LSIKRGFIGGKKPGKSWDSGILFSGPGKSWNLIVGYEKQ